MKRISLTKQLFIIFFGVLLVTTFTFFSVLSGWLIETYTGVNYQKLDEFAGVLESIIDEGYSIEDFNFNNNIEYVIWDNNEKWIYTSNINDILTEEYIDEIYDDLVVFLEDEEFYRSKLESIDDYFYSAIKTDSNYYILTVSSGLLINQMKEQTGIQITILFVLILLGGGLIIVFWSNILVSRISKISSFVTGMKATSYSIPNIDDGNDEIGQLSLSIDEMRKQIFENEETKKEIIQNLSHDIKTPLAVIKSYAEAIVDEVESPEAGLIIIKQSDMLQGKVEKLLQLNRLNYLELDRQLERVCIKDLINRVVGSNKYLTSIIFELDLDDSILMGYEENYQTLIENIISNAIRYANTSIKITLKNSVMTFYNDGEHIEDKFIEKGFKAYEMGSKGEFGVGMSIVKRTTEFFNLEFYVRNEEIGVSFIIADPTPTK